MATVSRSTEARTFTVKESFTIPSKESLFLRKSFSKLFAKTPEGSETKYTPFIHENFTYHFCVQPNPDYKAGSFFGRIYAATRENNADKLLVQHDLVMATGTEESARNLFFVPDDENEIEASSRLVSIQLDVTNKTLLFGRDDPTNQTYPIAIQEYDRYMFTMSMKTKRPSNWETNPKPFKVTYTLTVEATPLPQTSTANTLKTIKKTLVISINRNNKNQTPKVPIDCVCIELPDTNWYGDPSS
jgi:hypothetical protein